ncbi:hypothetical protein A0H81_10906 [Grifola frondosa]|uniref:Uncharacterized protein n=1 Tax=Grifola frondosa TaxID=5627 RepID=A0A1C7LX72_GRIFR|nr:hypothetical protein A0H81_10906 [Grifola frondosa]
MAAPSTCARATSKQRMSSSDFAGVGRLHHADAKSESESTTCTPSLTHPSKPNSSEPTACTPLISTNPNPELTEIKSSSEEFEHVYSPMPLAE